MAKPWPKHNYKQTEETLGLIESILRIDWTIEEASRHAGIDPDTYYRWVKSDKDLYDRFEKAKQYPFILARKTLMKGMQDGDNKSAIEYLKRRDNRYRDKSESVVQATMNIDPLWDKLKEIEENE